MSFKYINPGYAELVSVIGESNYIANIDATGKSKTGAAFKNTSSKNYFAVTLSNAELWFKCDVYIPAPTSSYSIQICDRHPAYNNRYYNGLSLNLTSSAVTLQCFSNNGTYLIVEGSKVNGNILSNTGIKFDSINSIWLHLKYGSSGTGFLEFQINNKIFDKIQDKNFPLQSTPTLWCICCGSNKYIISNIIISDEYIHPKETVIALPIISTESNMTFDSETGIYTATSANQTLFSAVDVESLNNEYGSDSTVTGIALIGNPAYEVDNAVTTLTSLTKAGVYISEHDTMILSSSENSAIGSYLMTDTSLAALSGFKFGWKAGN